MLVTLDGRKITRPKIEDFISDGSLQFESYAKALDNYIDDLEDALETE